LSADHLQKVSGRDRFDLDASTRPSVSISVMASRRDSAAL